MAAPPGTVAGWPRWRRSWWYHATFYAQTWRGSVMGTVLLPVFYLAAMGVGVGHLVSAHSGLVGGQTYLHFIAPSLLATTAMQLGEGESLWPVLASVKWIRTYHAAAATPLEPTDILGGKLTFVATRALGTSAVYTVIIAAFGAVHSWWGLTLPLIGTLITLSFAAPLTAFAATVETDASFTTIYRFAFVPMFLFSATFYPVSAYPGWLRPVVQAVPLYHGVALARAAAFGHGATVPVLAHLAVLVGLSAVGIAWGRRTLTRRLVD
jgi:lipooligosaccharide transport system permease protein